jgi:hypothetical protein
MCMDSPSESKAYRGIAEVISRQSLPKAGMAKRFTVNLPDLVAAKLQAWADSRDQPFASVAAIAIERAVDAAIENKEVPPALLEKTLQVVIKTGE